VFNCDNIDQVMCVQVSPLGLGYGDGPDISPMSGTVEFEEGMTSALAVLSVIDDVVGFSVLCCLNVNNID